MQSRRRTGGLTGWGWPAPFPDELSIGLVPRALARWGNLDANGLLAQYGLAAKRLAHPLLPVLPSSAQGGMSDLLSHIKDHTLVPYYAAYAARERRKQMWSAATSAQGARLGRVVAVGWLRRYAPRTLRYCGECGSVDRERYGEPYWHRHHQIPGISRCAIHRSRLFESDTPAATARLLNVSRPPRMRHVATLASPLFRESLERRIAQSSYRALRDASHSNQFVGVDGYRDALRLAGFGDDRGRIRADAVSRLLASWLRSRGCRPELLGPGDWWLALFTRVSGALTPLQHLVFRCFVQDAHAERYGDASSVFQRL